MDEQCLLLAVQGREVPFFYARFAALVRSRSRRASAFATSARAFGISDSYTFQK